MIYASSFPLADKRFIEVRIVSGVLFTIHEHDSTSPRSGVYIAAQVFHSIGLPVLLGCLAFFCSELPQLLFLIGYSIDDSLFSIDLYLNIVNAANTAGLILVIFTDVKVVNLTEAAAPHLSAHIGLLYKVASFLFVATYVALAVIYVLFWASAPCIFDLPDGTDGRVVSAAERRVVTKILRNCITIMLLAFPPLAVRVVYDVLSAFAPTPIFSDTGIISSNPASPLAKYSVFTGSWQIFLGMSEIMEELVVFIYIAARLNLPKTIQFFQHDTPPEPLKRRLLKRRKGPVQ